LIHDGEWGREPILEKSPLGLGNFEPLTHTCN